MWLSLIFSLQYLKTHKCYDEAATQLASMVNDDGFVSIKGKTRHELWAELCELVVKNPDQISSLNVDAIVRGGTSSFPIPSPLQTAATLRNAYNYVLCSPCTYFALLALHFSPLRVLSLFF